MTHFVTHNFLIGWLIRDALDAPKWRWIGLNHANAESLFPVCARPKRQHADHPSLRERA